MYLRSNAGELVGQWSGENSLWLSPTEPVREAATKATVTTAAAGRFLVVTYVWSDLGKRHDGVLMVRVGDEPSPVDMVWVDSFHTAGKFMQFAGSATDDGSIEASTTWSAGDGSDWGWRIVLVSADDGELVIRMFIATPEGEEAPAVESRYRRTGTSH